MQVQRGGVGHNQRPMQTKPHFNAEFWRRNGKQICKCFFLQPSFNKNLFNNFLNNKILHLYNNNNNKKYKRNIKINKRLYE